MDAQPKRGLAVTLVLFIFGLTASISQLKDGFNSKPIGFITNRVQSHGYNITSLSEKPNCRVRIIDNLNSTDLKVIQDERKSRIKEVCDMCSRNRTPVECNHVTLDTDYHRDPPVMYNFLHLHRDPSVYNHLLVNDKHKVRDWSHCSPSTMILTYKCQIYSVKDIFNSNLYFIYLLMFKNRRHIL